MHPDKKIMWIGLVLLIAFSVAGFYFRDMNFHEEEALLDEAIIISENIPEIYFTPYSNQERIVILEDYLEKITAAQNKISKTILAKLFIDYKDTIDHFKNELSELRQNDDEDKENEVSFQTREEHSIISDREFTRETLLNFASIIDSAFPGTEGNALFILKCQYGYVTVVIIPFENPENFEKIDLEGFAELLSREVFNHDSVYIRLDFMDPDNAEEESING